MKYPNYNIKLSLKKSSNLLLKKLQNNWDNYDIYDLYDGSLIKLFYYNNTWNTATNKCINATHSKLINSRSYADLFNDINLDYSILDKNKCYAFILLHKENKLICEYPKPMIVHLGTFNLNTLSEEKNDIFNKFPELDIESLILTDNNYIYKPKKRNFSSFNSLIESFDNINYDNLLSTSQNNKILIPGYFIINKLTGQRIKIINPKYQYLQYIKGNNRNMIYYIIDLQKNKYILDLLLRYFPEYKDIDEYIKGITKKLVYYIYTHWHYKYINNNICDFIKTEEHNSLSIKYNANNLYPEFKDIFDKILIYIKNNNLSNDYVNPELIMNIMMNNLDSKQILNLYGALMHNIQCTT
jgi:hypothetical protein